MSNSQHHNPLIIGLTGSFGSGCSYVADHILEPRGYANLSLSEILKDLYRDDTGQDPREGGVPRAALQDYGDRMRKEHGGGFFADKAIERISKELKSHPERKWVVDSVRNPMEVRALREYSRKFFLFGICAEREMRWERVKGPDKYNNDYVAFLKDDDNDKGDDNPAHGQRVGDCFSEADIVISNEEQFKTTHNRDFEAFSGFMGQFVDLVENPLHSGRPIKQEEALMAMAYAASQQSSCLKRKVGAVIVDSMGSVISSGYNEVPRCEQPCRDEYRGCFRDHLWTEFTQEIRSRVPAAAGDADDIRAIFREKFKLLDYCRALHAEESAILNLARCGRSLPLEQCSLYATTYPCRLCAQKIADIGIKTVVYLESYPQPDAKVILDNADVNSVLFQGVTSKAYFRIYGAEK